MNKNIFTTKSKKDAGNCEVEIIAEISAENLEEYKVKALKSLGEKISLPGFRPGHIPEKVIKEKVGEMAILENAVEIAIDSSLIELIIENVPNFLGRPDISITKIALGAPVEIKIVVTTSPEVKLPDYKKIASKENSKPAEKVVVEEKEIEETIEQIRKMFVVPQKEGEPKVEPVLPEINDEFVKKLGAFKDVADFKDKMKENILKEKERRAQDKRRMLVLDGITEKSEIKMPKILVESELDKMQAQFEDDIKKSGIKTEDYLKHTKKTWADLRKEWTPDAEKRAKLQLILNKIANEEKIEAPKEDVEKESKHMQEHYKDVPPERIKAYVEMILVNEKVLKFLEEVK